MRTKALLGLAALAVGALTATAQNNVYSLNVVGYYNKVIPAGKYVLVANQLKTADYTVSKLLTVPDNTTLYKWLGSGYAINTFAGGAWDDDAMTLGPGEAAFVKNNSAADFTITFVGEVNQDANTHTIGTGYKMASLFTPQAGLLSTDFGYAAPDNEQVYKWGGNGFAIYTFSGGEWDEEPSVAVGEGFFFKSAAAHTWARTFKVQ